MTACDATLVTVQEDGGVYTASLALSSLMVMCVRVGAEPIAHGSSRQCLPVFRQQLQQC